MIKGSGPAFVGQVFSMCDLSGSGLMAVSTHFNIPFISKRTPEWLKKMFASVGNSERNGPVFRFFMDLGDAVTYVKRLNIPSGVVGDWVLVVSIWLMCISRRSPTNSSLFQMRNRSRQRTKF